MPQADTPAAVPPPVEAPLRKKPETIFGVQPALLAGFVAVNLLIKFLFIRINLGEYTDGILQLLVLEIKAGLYPPLYGILASAISVLGVDLEQSGRIVSVIAGGLGVIPVCMMARRLGGKSSVIFAAVFYTISPMIMRWSVRVMTDALFFTLCATALWMMMEAWERARVVGAKRNADLWLAGAALASVAAALTRYQGAFLAILWLLPAGAFVRYQRKLPLRAMAVSLLWIALPAWMAYHGMVHSKQFQSRSMGGVFDIFLDYLNVAESFVYIAPYYFGLPVFLFALLGMARMRRIFPHARAFIWLWSLWAVIILVLQAMFQSFQYRYMMPVMPAVLVLAGVGAEEFERHMLSRGRRKIYSLLMLGAVIYLTVFTCAVMVFQRATFGDQREAARFIREEVPPSVPVFSNEQYGAFTNLGSVKLTYWTGRRVSLIGPYLSRNGTSPPEKFLPTPCVVVLGDAYGGDPFVVLQTTQLNLYYHMRTIGSAHVTTYPILDDVMANPMFNQNPMGWVLRYKAQFFSTQIVMVDSLRTPAEMRDLAKRMMVSSLAVDAVDDQTSTTAIDSQSTTNTLAVDSL